MFFWCTFGRFVLACLLGVVACLRACLRSFGVCGVVSGVWCVVCGLWFGWCGRCVVVDAAFVVVVVGVNVG